MLPDSSRNLVIDSGVCLSVKVEVDCQKQQIYCLGLHFLDFAIANLLMILMQWRS